MYMHGPIFKPTAQQDNFLHGPKDKLEECRIASPVYHKLSDDRLQRQLQYLQCILIDYSM